MIVTRGEVREKSVTAGGSAVFVDIEYAASEARGLLNVAGDQIDLDVAEGSGEERQEPFDHTSGPAFDEQDPVRVRDASAEEVAQVVIVASPNWVRFSAQKWSYFVRDRSGNWVRLAFCLSWRGGLVVKSGSHQ